MVAYKASQVPGFIRNPDAGTVAALVYGPEASLVSERARGLTKRLAQRVTPEAEVRRVDDRDLADEPDLVAIELQTPSLFAEHRIIHVKGEGRLRAERLKELLEGDVQAVLVVEAGNLRPASPVRKLFESMKCCAALPCYADTGRDLAPVIEAELEAGGVRASREVRGYLLSRLGTDVGIARSECAKLAAYVGAGNEATAQDIDAVVGDVSAGLADTLAQAAADGRTALALKQLDALLAGGQSTHAALSALSRHFQRLHRVCAAVESGTPAKSAVSRFKPKLHFRLQDSLVAQSRKWSEAGAARALMQVNDAVRATRLTPRLETELTERLVLALRPR